MQCNDKTFQATAPLRCNPVHKQIQPILQIRAFIGGGGDVYICTRVDHSMRVPIPEVAKTVSGSHTCTDGKGKTDRKTNLDLGTSNLEKVIANGS
jgi:hypothetical protein